LGVTLGWSYDSFGNRLGQSSTTPNLPSVWVNYGANNQATLSSLAMGGLTYDNAGDVKNDGVNQYAYDAEGRICAVWNGLSFTGYVYDGEGNRVAKGSITGLNCNFATNGFSLTSSYVNGLGGEQLTEMKASGAWDHSNVFAGGTLLATYSGTDTYFAFNDWLGTKRAQLRVSDGCLETYASLPFGDKLTPAGNCPDASEQHFTGKIRDAESGNDYFGARYFASDMGRWLSPDWSAKAEPVPYAKLYNPQSLNLYAYVNNNPLSAADPDGHDGDICKAPGADCTGKAVSTKNYDGTTTVKQGTTTPVENRDSAGKVTSVTTTSTITTVKLDADGKVASATQDQSVTNQKVNSKGNPVGPSKDVSGGFHGATISQTSTLVSSLQAAGQSWKQTTGVGDALDMIPGAKAVPGENILTKLLNHFTVNDLLKPDPPSLGNYTCVKAGINCF